MRQAVHIGFGIAFWALLVGLWVLLAVDGRASGAAFRDTGLQLAALTGAVLAITVWWIRHNVGIYRRSGFEVVGELTAGPIPVWFMERPPA